MDLDFSPEELAFREEVRAFINQNLPAAVRDRTRRGDERCLDEDIRSWQRTLHARGWGAPAWPVEFGGTGWNKTQQYLFEVESALAYAPFQLPFGLKMVAPVLMRFGSPEQQRRFLPRILDGTDWWCQGYSEPAAGSDLASLATRAERNGDEYVVNGQKAWNTLGQYADWIFCLVRTDTSAKPQRGISFLLIDMKTPGIRVTPTRLLDGSFEVNEIWFDNVRVPVSQRVGEENEGWTCAKYLLGYERTGIAFVGIAKRELERLKQMAMARERDGVPLLRDPSFGARVAQVELELCAQEITNLRVIADEERRKAPGPEASILKVRGSEILQRISELQLDAVGARAVVSDAGDHLLEEDVPRAVQAYLNFRKLSIYGGANEIQRNIIAQMLLKI
jgi:alkylation response protein AidB-like acyl-CoA dehydrogenase